MELTKEQWKQVRLLSDNVLYSEAEDFIEKHGTIDGQKQMNSLLNRAHSMEEVESFIRRQAQRSWPEKKEHYGQFYNALLQYVHSLRRRVVKSEKSEFRFVLDNQASTKERKKMVELLAQEFILHLVAENLWKEKNINERTNI